MVTFPTMTISASTRLSEAKHDALMAVSSTIPESLLDGLCNDCIKLLLLGQVFHALEEWVAMWMILPMQSLWRMLK
jgi:hypothetical protein